MNTRRNIQNVRCIVSVIIYILSLLIRYILSYKSFPPSMHNDVQRRSVTHTSVKKHPSVPKKEPAPPLRCSVHIAHQGAVLTVTSHHIRRRIPETRGCFRLPSYETGNYVAGVVNTSGGHCYKNSSSLTYRISWAELGT